MDLNIYWKNNANEIQDEMVEKRLSGHEDYLIALHLRNDIEVKSRSISNQAFTESGLTY